MTSIGVNERDRIRTLARNDPAAAVAAARVHGNAGVESGVGAVSRDAALRLAEQIRNERRKRRALRDLAKDTAFEPPELFWWSRGEG